MTPAQTPETLAQHIALEFVREMEAMFMFIGRIPHDKMREHMRNAIDRAVELHLLSVDIERLSDHLEGRFVTSRVLHGMMMVMGCNEVCNPV